MSAETRKPSRRPVKYDWDAITEDLRRSPGEWVRVLEQGPRSLYSSVKRQRMLALRDRDWVYEVCTRDSNEDRTKADIWMMARPREKREMGTWDSRL